MAGSEMTYRPLGRCGMKISVLGLGGWTTYGGSITDAQAVRTIIHAAFEAGVNFFDTADVYAKGEAERVMGKALGELPRHRLVIASKVFFPMSDDVNDRGLSRKHIMESVDKSLKRLGTDYLDIYFCHRFDPDTPVEETTRAMDDLIRHGKVLYWGTSEWTGRQIEQRARLCDSHGYSRPKVEQAQYSLLARSKFEQDVRSTVSELGLGMVAWSPLASGLLSGKYDEGIPEGSRLAAIDWLREGLYEASRLESVRKFKAVADEVGCTRAQLALAWVMSRPNVSSAIMGATRVEQLQENLGALGVNVSSELNTRLDELFPVSGNMPH